MRFLLILAALPLFAQRPLPVDNEWARVIVAQNTPGQKSRPHKHDVNRVMIHLSPGAMRLAFQDGPTNEVKFKAGDVRWDPKGGIHTSENVGGTTYQIVEVELKKPGGAHKWPDLDPVRLDPSIYIKEFENDQVRVVRVKIPANGAIPNHTHGNRLAVALTNAEIDVTTTEGTTATAVFKPGDVRFGTPGSHSEKSKLATASELIMIDLKGN